MYDRRNRGRLSRSLVRVILVTRATLALDSLRPCLSPSFVGIPFVSGRIRQVFKVPAPPGPCNDHPERISVSFLETFTMQQKIWAM